MNCRPARSFCLTVVIVVSICFVLVEDAKSDIMLFTDEATWLSHTSYASSVGFAFTADNVALADEVFSPPAPLTFLGHQLTFQSGNTGLPFDFVFREERSATIVEVVYTTNALGAGPTWEHDWSVVLGTGQPVLEIGLELGGNTDTGTFYRIFDTSDNEIGILSGGQSNFLGIVSDVAIGHILYDDTDISGGVGLWELKVPVVPVPGAVILGTIGLVFAGWLGKRKNYMA